MTFPPELFNELQRFWEINIGTMAEQRKIENEKMSLPTLIKIQVLEKNEKSVPSYHQENKEGDSLF